MRRTDVIAAVMFGIVLSMQVGAFGQAQQTKKPSHNAWMNLDGGGKVLRLFETKAGPKTPEIAILQLHESKYESFDKDPTTFVKDNDIFPNRKILKVVHAKESDEEPKAKANDAAGEEEETIVIVHTICKGVYSYVIGAHEAAK